MISWLRFDRLFLNNFCEVIFILIPFTLSQLYASVDALRYAADTFLDFDKFCFLTDFINTNISAAEGYYLNHDGYDWIVDIPDDFIQDFYFALIIFCRVSGLPKNVIELLGKIKF